MKSFIASFRPPRKPRVVATSPYLNRPLRTREAVEAAIAKSKDREATWSDAPRPEQTEPSQPTDG
jgi:hypothetical protein